MAYSVTPTYFGYRLTFSGRILKPEMYKWLMESTKMLAEVKHPIPFQVYVDMVGLSPLAPDVQDVLVSGQALYRRHGMNRSAVLSPSQIITQQFKNAAANSGIASGERVFQAEAAGAETHAMEWLLKGIESPLGR